jgi:PTH1 family peptidyl-tRNA hydrolase
MHLVVGLGNPGAKYQDNRHNLGFMVADELLRRGGGPAKVTMSDKFGASLGQVTVAGQRLLVCKPMQFMNVSGQVVASVARFWKIELDHTIVVHDELDIPFERLKLGAGGGPGGHNGVRSVIGALGDPGFARVRIGVGRPAPSWDPADYLLANFTRAEAVALPDIVGRAADAVEAIAAQGLTAAMNKFNTKPQSGKNSAKDNDNRG